MSKDDDGASTASYAVLEQLAGLLEGSAESICARWLAARNEIAAAYEERVQTYRRTRVPWASREEVERPWATPFGGRTGSVIDAICDQVGGELRRREPIAREMASVLGDSVRRSTPSDTVTYLLCLGAMHRWAEGYVKQLFFDVLAGFSAEERVRQEMVHGHWMMLRGDVGGWVSQHARAIVRAWDPATVMRIDKVLTDDATQGIRGLRTVHGWSAQKAWEMWGEEPLL